jgi:hypothetical protein
VKSLLLETSDFQAPFVHLKALLPRSFFLNLSEARGFSDSRNQATCIVGGESTARFSVSCEVVVSEEFNAERNTPSTTVSTLYQVTQIQIQEWGIVLAAMSVVGAKSLLIAGSIAS